MLGPILELPTQDRSSLLSTLQAWFDAGGSAVETGKRIYCHPNTVRYRLRRLQKHTGRSLDDPKAVAELLAALDALRLVHGTSWLGESCSRAARPLWAPTIPEGDCCRAGHCRWRRPRGRFRAATDTSTEAAMTNLALTLAEATAMYPERAAVRLDELVLTYQGLDERSARVAGLLAAHNVEPGDRVGLLLPNVPQFPMLYYGCCAPARWWCR